MESKTKLYKRSVGAIEKFKENRKVPVSVKVTVGVLNKHFVINEGTFGAEIVGIKEMMADIKESAKRKLRGNIKLN